MCSQENFVWICFHCVQYGHCCQYCNMSVTKDIVFDDEMIFVPLALHVRRLLHVVNVQIKGASVSDNKSLPWYSIVT